MTDTRGLSKRGALVIVVDFVGMTFVIGAIEITLIGAKELIWPSAMKHLIGGSAFFIDPGDALGSAAVLAICSFVTHGLLGTLCPPERKATD